MENFQAKALGTYVRKSAGGAPVFRISSGVLDRVKDRVLPDSIKTENYERNPVLLWNHQPWEPAIGTAKVYRDGAEWFMEPAFDHIGQLSKDVADKVDAGTLRTCSIGFRIVKYEPNTEGGLDYEEIELLEVSITNIPCNPEAERVKNQTGSTSTTQKNNETPPPEAPPAGAKALDADTMAAIRSLMDECMKPCLEVCARIEEKVDALSGEEASEETPSETEPKGADAQDEGMEMTPEEEKELKSFFHQVAPTRAK